MAAKVLKMESTKDTDKDMNKSTDEAKVKEFFSSKKNKKELKEESSKVKQFIKETPVKMLVFLYNAGLFVITAIITMAVFMVCVGLDTVLPSMLFGLMGYDLNSTSAINTMAMLSIVILTSGALIALMVAFTKTMYKKVYDTHKLVTERSVETGKLNVKKNNDKN